MYPWTRQAALNLWTAELNRRTEQRRELLLQPDSPQRQRELDDVQRQLDETAWQLETLDDALMQADR